MSDEKRAWIEPLEIEDAQIKWPFSHFDGKADTYNEEGEHNFMVIIPEEQAKDLRAIGWNIKENEPMEEGDPPEYLLKVNISYRFSDPMVFFLKGTRRMRAKQSDLQDIRRATCERIDVIIKPNPWSRNGNSGISAYLEELYATIRESRFSAKYADYEEIGAE